MGREVNRIVNRHIGGLIGKQVDSYFCCCFFGGGGVICM